MTVLGKLVLMDENSFVVSDESGDVGESDPADGLYHNDVRFLSTYELRLNGEPLAFLAAPYSDSTAHTSQLTNRRFQLADGTTVLPQTLGLQRTRFLRDGLHERLTLVSYNRFPIPFRLEFVVAADFRDMFDIRGIAKPAHGELLGPVVHRGEVRLRYRGEDGLERATCISCDPPFTIANRSGWDHEQPEGDAVSLPDAGRLVRQEARHAEHVHLMHTGVLEPHQPYVVELQIRPNEGAADACAAPTFQSFEEAAQRDDARGRAWRDEHMARVTCSSEMLARLLERSRIDLYMLTRWPESGPFPVAGIPWFACPFGRDSLIAGLETLSLAPDLAVGTLRYLASRLGTEVDDRRDEEPGKVLHELRFGELARIGAIPQTPYYGSVDSTPLFLMLLCEVDRWVGDGKLLDELWPAAQRALEWIERYGDLDGDGFLEYCMRTPMRGGSYHQGWKDSHDSATHRDGTQADPPIALIEVQAYAYAARRGMACLFRRRGDEARAAQLERDAEALRRKVRDAFWMADEGTYAEGLDARKGQIGTVTSNGAHALYGGLAYPDDARSLAERLGRDDMVSGWGLRTLSTRAPSYNPMSYHNGSVWPHDNAIAVAGLLRYGERELALRLFDQVFQAAQGFRFLRLPELYCGFPRWGDTTRQPAAYPVSCSPQAWAAGAPYLMLSAMLGLEPDARARRLTLRPALPSWLSWIQIENMRVGGDRVSFRLSRSGDGYALDRTAGDVAVAFEP